MQYTENLKLKKLEMTDSPPDITELNDNWDIIEAFAKGLRMKTYTNLSQIGLETGSETIESILTAMPANSILYVEVGASNADIYPTQYGLFIAKKLSTSRWFAEFYPKETTEMYVCSAKTENSTFTFYDWEKKIGNTELEALKKSVSDGKTLVADAITAKGVDTATDATFQTMADNISLIETGIPGLSAMYSLVDSFVKSGFVVQEMVNYSARTRAGIGAFEQSITSDTKIDMICIILTGGCASGVSTSIIIPDFLSYGCFVKSNEKTYRTNAANAGTIPLNELVMPGKDSITETDLYGVLSDDKKTFTLYLGKDVTFCTASGWNGMTAPKIYLYAYSLNNESIIKDGVA